MTATDCNDAQEHSASAKCCSAESSRLELEDGSANDDFCYGSNVLEGNSAQNTFEENPKSDQNELAIVASCEEACCSKENVCEPADSANDDEAKAKGNCQDLCCSDNSEKAINHGCQDACCLNDSGRSAERDHGNSYKSEKPIDASTCCEGKPIPCCDDSCIERIAIRECERDCGEKAPHRGSRATGTACVAHKKRTHKKYGGKLAALQCICRALVALGQESCCITEEHSRTRQRRGVERSSDVPLATSTDIRRTEYKAQISACKRKCCGSTETSSTKTKPKGKSTGRAMQIDSGGDESIHAVHPQNGSTDVEKGASGIEHITLSITGMTCTGCETKLERVLVALPAISNLRTSVVMARAEFNLDTRSMSSEKVMKHLERTTEFKFERISTTGSSLDVIPNSIKDFLDQPPALGVIDMQLIGKDMVRINFDPKVVGARSLIKGTAKYACQLAPPPIDPGLAASNKHVRNIGYTTLLSVVLTIPVLVLAWAPIEDRSIAYGAASLVLATIIQFIVAGPFYPKALKSLIFSRMIEMDLLIVLSTSAAYIFSVVSFGYLVTGSPLSTGEFFETSTLLVTLIMIGRWIAALSRQKAVESISISSLQSSIASLVIKDSAEIQEIDTRLLEYGDIFRVLPEHRVPTDGIILEGSSEIDESMLTGESSPVTKYVGSTVIAGSINGSGTLIVRLTHLPGENTISVIAGMVDNAKLSKPKIQELADRVATLFVPVIISLTVITFVVWLGVGISVRGQSGSDAAIQAITYAITVLIVSCPCAIGLAVPMVIVIGSGSAAERGIIFKSADSIERAYKATHVVFDKTGTLTTGKLRVVEKKYLAEDTVTLQSMIFGLVANSKHPVSAAIAANLIEQGVDVAKVSEIKTLAGKGIEGKHNGKVVRGGNARWLQVESDPRVRSLATQGHTIFCITVDSSLSAVFSLADTIRPEAASIVTELKQKGIRVSVLSGDDIDAVQHVATKIGLNSSEARSRCSPSDKQKYIQELLSPSDNSKTKPIVVFVGDGTNDAVALAQAMIGVHMGSGTDVAQSAADVVLMRESLEGILTMMNISRAAVLRIKFNFGWSFVYNIVALLFASGALASAHKGTAIRIPPEYAGLGELVSVLPVIAIAVSLRWARF